MDNETNLKKELIVLYSDLLELSEDDRYKYEIYLRNSEAPAKNLDSILRYLRLRFLFEYSVDLSTKTRESRYPNIISFLKQDDDE